MTTSREKRNFLSWVFSEVGRGQVISGSTVFGWAVAIFIFLYTNWWAVPGFTLTDALKTEQARFFMGSLAAFHAFTCFLLTWAIPRPTSQIPSEPSKDVRITEEAARRIHRKVMYLYTSLALLYTTYAFFTFKNLPEAKQHWGQLSEILTATVIFFLYVELSELTVIERVQTQSESGTITEVTVSGDALRHRILFVGIAAALFLLSVLSYRYHSAGTQFTIRLIVACLSGVTLALVIGRLGSIYINPGAGVLSLLYLYAVIQPFAAFFKDVRFDFIVTSLALPLKILLWLVFVWAFTTGKLWEYVQEIREFLERHHDVRWSTLSTSATENVAGQERG